MIGAASEVTQSPSRDETASSELIRLLSQWRSSLELLIPQAQALCSRFPYDRDARFLLAEFLLAAGKDDLAGAEYERLLGDCPANERIRVEQGISRCRADRSYFSPVYAQRLATGEYSTGHNAQVWKDYAWREIQRGREIVRLLRQAMPLRGRRVLDVGSGYAGMLLCLAEQGAEAVGVEIDPERARMGRQRIRDLNMQISYHEGDICDEKNCHELGTFDVIICQDVLEHVLNPARVIASLCSILRAGGFIYVQIPNKYGIDQLMSDHHFALTGITALSRFQATEYWRLATGGPAEHYDVGYERGEKFYTAAFRKSGVTLNPIERYPSVEHVLWFADSVSQMCKRLEQPIFPGLRPELETRIRRRMTLVARLYAHASEQIIALQDQPEILAAACDAVVRRLCVGLWRFIGAKEKGPPSA